MPQEHGQLPDKICVKKQWSGSRFQARTDGQGFAQPRLGVLTRFERSLEELMVLSQTAGAVLGHSSGSAVTCCIPHSEATHITGAYGAGSFWSPSWSVVKTNIIILLFYTHTYTLRTHTHNHACYKSALCSVASH